MVGDFGMGNGNERMVASEIQALPGGFEAFVTTGDNVYPDGSPDHFAEAWTDPYGWIPDAGIPVIASLGNHDRETDAGAQVADELGMPADWYVRRVGPVDVIVLDVGQVADPDADHVPARLPDLLDGPVAGRGLPRARVQLLEARQHARGTGRMALDAARRRRRPRAERPRPRVRTVRAGRRDPPTWSPAEAARPSTR